VRHAGDSEAFRRDLVSRIPRWYVPWVHLVGPSMVGVPVIAFAVSRVRSPRAWEVAAAGGFFVLANLIEWLVHRDVLHHRVRFLEIAFVRHTPQHHGAFDAAGMAIHDPRELKLVLLPAFGVLAMFAAAIPPGLVLAALVSPNVGALWVAVGVGYVLAYEWLHLSYHLPPESAVGRLALVRVLRRHHVLHHTPALMQRANFNVTLPLWDWLLGTLVREPPPAATSLRDGA
jgi:sterol desaturase/sphingolipid hydroxylase (fatty acid hydroxylase superfamily)